MKFDCKIFIINKLSCLKTSFFYRNYYGKYYINFGATQSFNLIYLAQSCSTFCGLFLVWLAENSGTFASKRHRNSLTSPNYRTLYFGFVFYPFAGFCRMFDWSFMVSSKTHQTYFCYILLANVYYIFAAHSASKRNLADRFCFDARRSVHYQKCRTNCLGIHRFSSSKSA